MYRFNISPASRRIPAKELCFENREVDMAIDVQSAVRGCEGNRKRFRKFIDAPWEFEFRWRSISSVGVCVRANLCTTFHFKCSGLVHTKLKYKHLNLARRRSTVQILVCWTNCKLRQNFEIAVSLNYNNHSSVVRRRKHIHIKQLYTHFIYQLKFESNRTQLIHSRATKNEEIYHHVLFVTNPLAQRWLLQRRFVRSYDRQQSAESVSNRYMRACCVCVYTFVRQSWCINLKLVPNPTRFAPKFQWYRFHIDTAMFNKRTMCPHHNEWGSYTKRNAHAEQDRDFCEQVWCDRQIVFWGNKLDSQGCLRSPKSLIEYSWQRNWSAFGSGEQTDRDRSIQIHYAGSCVAFCPFTSQNMWDTRWQTRKWDIKLKMKISENWQGWQFLYLQPRQQRWARQGERETERMERYISDNKLEN